MTVADSRRLTGPLPAARPARAPSSTSISTSPAASAASPPGARGRAPPARRRGLVRAKRSPCGRSPAAPASRSPRRSTPSTPRPTSTRPRGLRASAATRRAARPSTSRGRRAPPRRRSRRSGDPALVALREAARARERHLPRRRGRRCRSASATGVVRLARAATLPDAGRGRLGARARRAGRARHRLERQDDGRAAARRHGSRRPAAPWGITSTDGVHVGGTIAGRGRLLGPERRAAAASPARGRGRGARDGARRPAAPRARASTAPSVAVVTNVADDHLGEFGIQDLDALADVKLLVARAVRPGGAVVLNADDPLLRARGAAARRAGRLVLARARPARARGAPGARAAAPRCWRTMRWSCARASRGRRWRASTDVPIALGGAARHNVANALAAMGAAAGAGRAGGRDAGGRSAASAATADDNPGRANMIELGGVQLVIDYAHNPHGMAALAEHGRRAAGPAAARAPRPGGRPLGRSHPGAGAGRAGAPTRPGGAEGDGALPARAPSRARSRRSWRTSWCGAASPPRRSAGREPSWRRCAMRWRGPARAMCCCSTVHQDRPLVLALLERLPRPVGLAGRGSAGAAVEETRPG